MLTRRFIKFTSIFRNFSVQTQPLSVDHQSLIEPLEDDKLQGNLEDEKTKELKKLSPSRIQNFLESNKTTLNSSHIVAALKNLQKAHKREIASKQQSYEHDKIHQRFSEYIETILNSDVSKFSASEAIEALEILIRMKIPNSSALLHTVLKQIYQSIDDLKLIEFNKLSVLLTQISYNGTPTSQLKKNILSVLVKKFIIILSLDFKENDLNYLQSAFSFISRNLNDKRHAKLIENFTNRLLNYSQEVPVLRSVLIFESLCNIGYYPEGWIELLQKTQQNIIDKADELNVDQILYIAHLIATKVKSTNQLYNEKLLDALVQKFIQQDTGFGNACSLVKSLFRMRHKSPTLLNYACATYFEKASLFQEEIESEIGKLSTLISGLAAAKHKTSFWNEIQHFITESKDILNYDHKTLCVLALHLTCLDWYPLQILEKIFDGTYDYSYSDYLHWTFCKIYQKVKSDPNYHGPMPTESQIKSLYSLTKKTFDSRKQRRNYRLKPYLEKELGESIYIKNNVVTRSFHIIEHVVFFHNNGAPVHISENEDKTADDSSVEMEYLEDLKVLPECKVVAILLNPRAWSFQNTGETMGQFAVPEETLEAMSYPTVSIQEDVWLAIPEKKKSAYLMDKIKSKLESR